MPFVWKVLVVLLCIGGLFAFMRWAVARVSFQEFTRALERARFQGPIE